MSKIQITSTESPFDRAGIASQAARVIAQADAMGLLGDLAITHLDLPVMRTVVRKVAGAGIGRDVQAALAASETDLDLEALLARLSRALDESPVPAFEWTALTALFEPEQLGQLLKVSSASLRRYGSGERKTPDAIAERLHFLATLVGVLAGAYNEVGIRRWFNRTRHQLNGATPADLLQGDWSSDDPGPQRVRALVEVFKQRQRDMIVFRHGDPRFPFLWETAVQPPARWHGAGEGPVHYFADTPDGAWAEFLRHEELTEPDDLASVRRAIWAVDLRRPPRAQPKLAAEVLSGGLETYAACQAEARRLRERGVLGLRAPSAALKPHGARGWRVNAGLTLGPARDGCVFILFGSRPDLVGWLAADRASPPAYLLKQVRPFG